MIFPDDLDKTFLGNFKKTIEKYIKKDYRFAIVCGGGKLARNFQEIASKEKRLTNEELDWLGIYATKINAFLLKSMLNENAENFIVDNPTKKIRLRNKIVIASGWKPGWSTDYDAVLLAKNLGVSQVVNMSNVDYVYTKDPRKFRDAKRIEQLKWKDYMKLVGAEWKAGMNAPFDPVAAREAEKSGIRVYILGKDLSNFGNFLDNKGFRGTVIS